MRNFLLVGLNIEAQESISSDMSLLEYAVHVLRKGNIVTDAASISETLELSNLGCYPTIVLDYKVDSGDADLEMSSLDPDDTGFHLAGSLRQRGFQGDIILLHEYDVDDCEITRKIAQMQETYGIQSKTVYCYDLRKPEQEKQAIQNICGPLVFILLGGDYVNGYEKAMSLAAQAEDINMA